jgi:hypothetical protein
MRKINIGSIGNSESRRNHDGITQPLNQPEAEIDALPMVLP